MPFLATLFERIKSTKLAVSTMAADADGGYNEDIWSFDDLLREDHSIPSLKGVLNTNDDTYSCAHCHATVLYGTMENNSVLHVCCGKTLCPSCIDDPAVYDQLADKCRLCNTPGITGIGIFKKQAKRGMPWAQNSLGVEYDDGDRVHQSHYDAMRWYRKASAKGHPRSTLCISELYRLGQGCVRDLEKAKQYALKAMEFDPRISRIASIVLGQVANDFVEDMKHEEAFSILQPLAERGSDHARYDLAYTYHLSEPSTALALARPLALRGHMY